MLKLRLVAVYAWSGCWVTEPISWEDEAQYMRKYMKTITNERTYKLKMHSKK